MKKMSYVKPDENHLAHNLSALRRLKNLSLEKVAERIGVTRQSVAKWETGESTPDVIHCDALAVLYGVSLDDLVHFNQKKEGVSVPPKGKHLFGTVYVGERGQIVIPEKARDMLGLKYGDTLVVLGDSTPATTGIALMPGDVFMRMANETSDAFCRKDEEE